LSLSSEASLMEFFKSCLKCGIGSDNCLLKTMTKVVDKVEETDCLKTVIGMLLSHSQTLTILLGHDDTKKGNLSF